MLKLLEFDYRIEYKRGAENTSADALSRKFQPDTIDSCLSVSAAVPIWMTDIYDSYKEDPTCTKLLQELAIDPTSNTNFTLQSGILRYKGRLVIGSTTDLRVRIFNSFHSSIFGGHSGSRVTHHRLKQLFYWPYFKQFVEKQIAECPTCQISKTEKLPYPGLLDPITIPKTKWSSISMDFIEGLPKSKGKDVILVVVDRLTKYAHFIPLAHPYTVHIVATALMDTVFRLHGPPDNIISERTNYAEMSPRGGGG